MAAVAMTVVTGDKLSGIEPGFRPASSTLGCRTSVIWRDTACATSGSLIIGIGNQLPRKHLFAAKSAEKRFYLCF